MAWANPVDPVSGTVITVAYAVASILGPIRHLRVMTGNADPPGSNYALISDSTSGVTWKKIPGDALADGSVSDVKLAIPKLPLTGGVLSGNLQISLTATPTQGYLILGNNGTYYVGFDGAKHLIVTPALHVQNDVYVYRSAAASTGYIILGNNSANFIGFDGTNVVTNTGTVITGGNIGSQTVASAGTATTATSANTLQGQAGAFYQGRANHTGTQLAATISDLATAVSGMAAASAGTAANAALLDSIDSADFSRTPSVNTYAGNDAGNRVITAALNREPALVIVGWALGVAVIMRNDVTVVLRSGAAIGVVAGGSLNANGFTVPSAINASADGTYTYHVIW